ncbi:hypothetical protein Tco_1271453, partial [Tanacetum coccineum]
EAHNEDIQRNLKFTSEDQVRGGLLGIIVNRLKSGSYRVKSGRHMKCRNRYAVSSLMDTVYLMRFLELGWHLEEIRVTWAHSEKKLTRLWTYTKSLEDLCIQRVEMASQA